VEKVSNFLVLRVKTNFIAAIREIMESGCPWANGLESTDGEDLTDF